MQILMHFQGVILGFVFIGMIVAPALVAARSGKEELQPDPVEETTAEVKAKPVARRVAAPVRPQETIMPVSKAQAAAKTPAPYYTSTVLPIHGRMGMAGR